MPKAKNKSAELSAHIYLLMYFTTRVQLSIRAKRLAYHNKVKKNLKLKSKLYTPIFTGKGLFTNYVYKRRG